MYKEQLSLFDENEDNNTAHLGNLNVVRLEFLEGHSVLNFLRDTAHHGRNCLQDMMNYTLLHILRG